MKVEGEDKGLMAYAPVGGVALLALLATIRILIFLFTPFRNFSRRMRTFALPSLFPTRPQVSANGRRHLSLEQVRPSSKMDVSVDSHHRRGAVLAILRRLRLLRLRKLLLFLTVYGCSVVAILRRLLHQSFRLH